jgi:WD40 repeat protein
MAKVCRLIGIFLIFFYCSPVNALEKPNDFAQSGYANSVNWYKISEAAHFLAIDDSERFLASVDAIGRKIRIWDIQSGRQVSIIITNHLTEDMFFIKNSLLVIKPYNGPTEIYSIFGKKIETLETLTKIKVDGRIRKISNNRTYLLEGVFGVISNRFEGISNRVRIINLENGSEVKLPDFSLIDDELYNKIDLHLYDLGLYIGHFKGISRKDLSDHGKEKLLVMLYDKETLNPVTEFQIDERETWDIIWAALDINRKYLYLEKGQNLRLFDINTGKKVCDIFHNNMANKVILKNGDIAIIHSEQDKKNIFAKHFYVSIFNIPDNCLTKEKKFHFDQATSLLVTNGGFIIVGYTDGSIKIYSISDGSVVKELIVKPVINSYQLMTM